MSEIGILGGTFDPFHYGHLSIAKAAMKEFNLSKMILLPAKVQPFKIGKDMASAIDRVNMVNLVAGEYEDFVVSTLEAYSEEISYTYKTLDALCGEYPEDKLHFILGTDSFLNLESWYKSHELLSKFSFIVGVRPGYKEAETREIAATIQKKYDTDILFLNNERIQVSSTEIKEKIKTGASIHQMVPFEIERYIDEHGLYK